MKTVRTNSKNEDFINLVAQLDAYLRVTDGDEHDFYNQYNSIETLQNVIVIYSNSEAVACGAFRPFDEGSVEIKRMYTLPQYRGQGFARNVIIELEQWAKELGYGACILETGKRQFEAVNFYQKNGYTQIENYGQYIGVANSLCFKKQLNINT
ncbi:GNAT family N-acetyltransferase [Winogradskyella sp. 3972H.M.0a.05]|uniref:GNAT family N-acetyltransferase n=1 Tax=Winogradskyella sp. 3972H.M.0a.05 TaxID=2950277 RepID=UPI0033984B43